MDGWISFSEYDMFKASDIIAATGYSYGNYDPNEKSSGGIYLLLSGGQEIKLEGVTLEDLKDKLQEEAMNTWQNTKGFQ